MFKFNTNIIIVKFCLMKDKCYETFWNNGKPVETSGNHLEISGNFLLNNVQHVL